MDGVRVVISIDFGTTYSGFTYAHKVNNEIITNDTWPDQIGPLKTNTVLQYDENFKFVEEWGYPALAKRPKKSKGKSKIRVNYRKAIIDYLKCMGK
ncbi:18477_t:CDS:2, partial [Rhizophagus irregularis]